MSPWTGFVTLVVAATFGVGTPPAAAQHVPRPHPRPVIAQELGIVRIGVTREPDAPTLRMSGIVTPQGCVMTILGAVEGDAPAHVVTSTGRVCDVVGVVGYVSSSSIMLLAVDWKGVAPPAMVFADRQSDYGARVRVDSLDPEAAGASRCCSATIGGERSTSRFELVGVESEIGTWCGSPVCDEAGLVVGLVNGFAFQLGFPMNPAAVQAGPSGKGSLHCVPVELVAFARPGPEMMPLEKWREKFRDIEEATELRKRADAAFTKDELVESLRCARRSVALDDRNSRGLEALGRILIKVGSVEEAIDPISRALELAPTDLRLVYAKAHALLHLSRGKEALEQTQRLVTSQPSHARYLQLHGAVLAQEKRWTEAQDFLERAEKADPEDKWTQKCLEEVRRRQKDTSNTPHPL